jgi:hypothetical protein
MAQLRGSSGNYSVGNIPPQVLWTVVRGDTSAFKVYVTDDSKSPLHIPDWTINMKIKRPNDPKNAGVITDDAAIVLELFPAADDNDLPGEFTVNLSSTQSVILQTGDIFDIQLSDPTRVWTVAQGSIAVIEDVTD